MCLLSSVGRNASNLRDDAKTVQILLNLNTAPNALTPPLAEDGHNGNKTIASIEAFQTRINAAQKPDGRVDPHGATLRALQAGMPHGFSAAKLQGIMIHATRTNIARYFPLLRSNMEASEINTPLRMAHFLAQLGHESAEFRYTEEIASGAAYEGRTDLGNIESGDGVRFKGRGLIQLTGRANYKKYGTARTADYLTGSNPGLLSTDPAIAVHVSCWFWTSHSLNTLADSDNITAITKVINGGHNGLADRKIKLGRAKFFLT